MGDNMWSDVHQNDEFEVFLDDILWDVNLQIWISIMVTRNDDCVLLVVIVDDIINRSYHLEANFIILLVRICGLMTIIASNCALDDLRMISLFASNGNKSKNVILKNL